MRAPAATGSGTSIGTGLSINAPPLPSSLPSSGGQAATPRPFADIGKYNANLFPTPVAPRMNPVTGAYVDRSVLQAQEKPRAPFADVPVLGLLTQGASAILGSSLLGDVFNPQ